MNRFIIILLVVISLILSACSGRTVAAVETQPKPEEKLSDRQPAALARKDTQGAVVVTVTPTNLDSPGETLEFSISMQTHSVELDMDLPALAVLSADTGLTVQAATWNGSKGGHHVEGTLSFPVQTDGRSLLDGANNITIRIQNVDAPQRVFSWDIQP